MRWARRALAGAAAVYAVGLALWLGRPEPLPALAPALGAGWAGLAALFAASGEGGAQAAPGHTPARRLARAALLGLAGGAAAPTLGATLLALRMAVHGYPELAQTALTDLLARTPVWAGAGLAAGLGFGMLSLALEAQRDARQPE
jgi:hypothetical protein